MMKRHLLYVLPTVLLLAGNASAQTVSLATSPQGTSNNALSAALGKVASEQAGLKVRVVPMGGLEQYGPQINTGRMDVAITSGTDVRFAYEGMVNFKDRPQTNLRAIASLYSFQVAFLVRKDSPIKTLSDLKGKRVPTKFSNQKAAYRHFQAAIAGAGLSESDFKAVPVPHVVSAAKDFVQGKLDVTWFAVGAGKVKEMAAQVGGIRYLPAATSDDAIARMRKYAPAAYIQVAQPRKSAPGIVGPTPVITETFVLFGGKHVTEDVVFKLLDTLHTQKTKLGNSFPRWNRYNPEKLHRDFGVPIHASAKKWYEQKGMQQAK